MSPQSADAGPAAAATCHVIVLAAGKGRRMASTRPKVLHRMAGRPLIEHVLRAAATLSPATTTVVVGHRADVIQQAVGPGPRFVRQEAQLGTAHALLQAESAFAGVEGSLVVLSGDVPRIRPVTLRRLVDAHDRARAAATVLTARLARPYGYGRLVRQRGLLASIVEEADATPAQRAIREVNSGIYVFDLAPLFETLRQIPAAGPRQERYLPALLALYRRRGLTVETLETDHPDEIRGINSQTELAEVSSLMRQGKNEELMAAGVTLEDPATTYIDADVVVGRDTVIHPGVMLEGLTTIGDRCELHAGVRIVNSAVGDDVTVNNYCVITNASVESGARDRSLRPPAPRHGRARDGPGRQLRRDQEEHAGRRLEGGPPLLSGRRGARRGGERGGRHHHLQLRRPHQARDRDRGRRVHRQRHPARGAPVTVGRAAYVAAGSCVTEDVAPRRAGHRARPPGEQDGLDGSQEGLLGVCAVERRRLLARVGWAATGAAGDDCRARRQPRLTEAGPGGMLVRGRACAASSATSATARSFRSCSTASASSSTGATTPPASPWCATGR